MSILELRAWNLLVVATAYWSNVARGGHYDGGSPVSSVAESLLQNGAFAVGAWLLIALWSRTASGSEPATTREITLALAICALSVLPSRMATVLALGALGVQFARSARTAHARNVAAVLFGLAVSAAWTCSFMMPLHTTVARLDAEVVRVLLRLVGTTVDVQGGLVHRPDTGFGIEVLAGCASSYPLANVSLAFIITTLYLANLSLRRDWAWFAASLAVSIVLSEARLAWMAADEADYFWLHAGSGATFYGLLAVGAALLFPVLAARMAQIAPAEYSHRSAAAGRPPAALATVLLRWVFVTLAVMVVATQVAQVRAGSRAEETSDVSAALAAAGLEARQANADGVLASAPDCADPAFVTTMRFEGQGQGVVRAMMNNSREHRFVYLGLVQRRLNSLAIAGRWAAAAFLHSIGMRREASSHEVFVVVLPSTCPALMKLDWSFLSPWDVRS